MSCLFRPVLLLALSLLLAACLRANVVSVTDGQTFDYVAARLAPDFRAHGILDSAGRYRVSPLPLAAFPQPAGRVLYERLFPGFLTPPPPANPRRGRFDAPPRPVLSFAERHQPGDEVCILPDGFTIRGSAETISVRLAGCARWNGDAAPDWFVLCRVEDALGPRDWFLVLTSTETTPLVPDVIRVYSPALRLSGAQAGRMAWQPSSRKSDVIDLEPGVQAVVAPPQSRPPRSRNETRLRH